MENNEVVTPKKAKRPINPARRAVAWKITDVTLAVLPLLVWGVIQRDVYFATGNGLTNGIGLAMLGGFVGIIISKKAQVLKGFTGFLMIFIILYCLKAIISDLVVIAGLATVGMGVSTFWTSVKKTKWERIRDKVETADANANSMAKVVEVVVRSGRV